MAPAPPRIDRYEVERLIGSGSFATVWLARDPGLGGHVAIKVLADNWAHDLRVRERFVEEGRLLWRLDDERLVRVHLVGETDDGRPYLVMGHADRGSLRERLASPATLPDAAGRAELLARIADGVAVLHAHGIVHRDLTPANVLFRTRHDGREQVLVADLGLAKALAASSGFTARAGTPGYMAPEQDHDLALVDARSDVYALGVLGRELLGTDAPPAVTALLAQATATDPDARPGDAAAFAARLRAAVAPVAVAPSPPPSPSPPPHRPRRRRWTVAVAAFGALVAVTAVVAVVLVRRGDDAAAAGVAWDKTHRVGVALPAGWRAGGKGGWRDRSGADGKAEPALVVGTHPFRWATDPTVAGAFVGLSPLARAAGETPEAFLASRARADCPAGPPVQERHGGRTWAVTSAGPCADGRTVVEAAAVDAAGLLYVQASAPAGTTLPVAALLDGVVVS